MARMERSSPPGVSSWMISLGLLGLGPVDGHRDQAEGDGADDAVDLDQRDGLGCPRRRQPEDDEHKRKNGDEEPLHGSRLTR